MGSGLCYVAMTWCVRKRGPVFTAAFSPLIQIFVAGLDFFVLKEEVYLGRLISFFHSFMIFRPFRHSIAPNVSLSAISSIAGSALVIAGMYILLWGKSIEGEQCVLKDMQANQDVECQ